MRVRQGDRRYQASIWRRLLGWILPERRDGWEKRARPAVAGSDKLDRRHTQVPFYDSIVDRRQEGGEIEQAPAVPAVPGIIRPDADEAAPVERERHLDGGIE